MQYYSTLRSDTGQSRDPLDNGSIVKYIVAALLITLLCIMCSGCRTTRYVPVVTVRTDTVQITKHQRDSVWLHDSIHVSEKQKDDTVWMEVDRWHTRYIKQETHDTTYIATHDTIPDPYPVPEYVEKPLTWWQQTRLRLANVILIAGIVWLVWFIIKKRIAILTVIRALLQRW